MFMWYVSRCAITLGRSTAAMKSRVSWVVFMTLVSYRLQNSSARVIPEAAALSASQAIDSWELARPRSVAGPAYLPSFEYRTPHSVVPPLSRSTPRAVASRSRPRATTSGSSLETSVSSLSPSDALTWRPCSWSSRAVMSPSNAVGSIGAISIRSYPASAVAAMAWRASSGDQPPVHTRAWTPWVIGMDLSSSFVVADACRSLVSGVVVEPAAAAQLVGQPPVALLERADLGGVGIDHLGAAHHPVRGVPQGGTGPCRGGQDGGAEGTRRLGRPGDRAVEDARAD